MRNLILGLVGLFLGFVGGLWLTLNLIKPAIIVETVYVCGATPVPQAACQVPTSTPTDVSECLCNPTDIPFLPTEFGPRPTETVEVPTRAPTIVPSITPEPTDQPPTEQPSPEPTECADDDDDHDDFSGGDDDCDDD